MKYLAIIVVLAALVGAWFYFGGDKMDNEMASSTDEMMEGENMENMNDEMPMDSMDDMEGMDHGAMDGEETGATAAAGTVTSVDLEQMAVDGPGLIMFEAEGGTEYTVAVPSMGLPLCAAKDNIADISAIKEGDKIEVNGSTGPAGQIVPCDSADHYLRVAAEGEMEASTEME